ncbi:MAG TPA: hypothetical protein VGE85_17975 [Terracidiphilus sp.]|jgi:hypothetical protein
MGTRISVRDQNKDGTIVEIEIFEGIVFPRSLESRLKQYPGAISSTEYRGVTYPVYYDDEGELFIALSRRL